MARGRPEMVCSPTIGRAPVVKRTPGLTLPKLDSRSAGAPPLPALCADDALAVSAGLPAAAAVFALLLGMVKLAMFPRFAVA